MRKRTAARVLAVQALYQYELHGPDFLKGLEDFLREASKDDEVIADAGTLCRACVERLDALDARIAAVSQHWEVDRMPAVDRAILRLGAYELLHRPDVPPKVALDEAIRMAKRLSTAESGKFVNGVLDKIMNQRPAPTGGTGA